jgi:hypothetical protein
MSDQRPKVRLFSTWEIVSARGNTYQRGWWGDVEVVAFVKEIPHPRRPDETVREWSFYAQERAARPQSRQDGERPPAGQSPPRTRPPQQASAARAGRALLDALPPPRARDGPADPGHRDTGDPSRPFDDEIPFAWIGSLLVPWGLALASAGGLA